MPTGLRARTLSLLALSLTPALTTPAVTAPGGAQALVRVEASRMSMACLYAIEAYGSDRERLTRLLEEALDEVDRIDRLMSHYKTDSPLSRLNRDAAGGPVTVDPELFDFLAAAIGYSRRSHGAFDITVGPLMKAWGFFDGDGRVPSPAELDAARARVGYRHVVLDDARRTVRFDRPGVELDLGGIAKGYAVDRVVSLLRRGGVTAALVSAGGSSVYGMGAPPGRAAWEVEVQDPVDANKVAFTRQLRDRALSISGGSEKWFEADGVRYTHVMDPRSGRPVPGILAVVVLTPDATTGDALDNALFVLGPGRSSALLRACQGSEATFLLPDGTGAWTRRESARGEIEAGEGLHAR